MSVHEPQPAPRMSVHESTDDRAAIPGVPASARKPLADHLRSRVRVLTSRAYQASFSGASMQSAKSPASALSSLQSGTIGTPFTPGATRVMLLGAGELGKEVIIALQRLGVGTIGVGRLERRG